jgi:TRAP-type uncharacterized transport system substrate-binding protein
LLDNPQYYEKPVKVIPPSVKGVGFSSTTLTGKVILQQYNITESRYELDRSNYPAGEYLLEMKGSKI